MNYIKKFCNKTVRYSVLNKFNYKQITLIPGLKKIVLTLDCTKENSIEKVAPSMLALEFLTKKRGKLIKAKKPHTILKIKKGETTGCKVYLVNKSMYNFIDKLFTEILFKLKNLKDFKISTNQINFASYTLNSNLVSVELEQNYFLLKDIPCLKILFLTNTRTNKELNFILNSIRLNTKSKCNSIGRV